MDREPRSVQVGHPAAAFAPPRRSRRLARPMTNGTLLGLLVAIAALAGSALMGVDRAGAESVVCDDGEWVAKGRETQSGGRSGISCEEAKPAWIFDSAHRTIGHIRFVYDGDRALTYITTQGGRITGAAYREVWEQGNKRPGVNQPLADGTEFATFTYIADANNRAVRGADGQCYREERVNGQWRGSGKYGADAEACHRASWNAYRQSQGLDLINPVGGTFPEDPPPGSPVLQVGTMDEPSAAVDWTTLTLTFNQALDEGSLPLHGAFRVTVNDATRNVASGGVAISGMTVTLTLTSAVSNGDTVTVSYTKPSAGALQSATGYSVETFVNQEVTNNTPVTLWTATLTAGLSGQNGHGCRVGSDTLCSDALTAASFTVGDTTYQVQTLATGHNGGIGFLDLALDQEISTDWTLYVDERPGLDISTAALAIGSMEARWTSLGFGWGVGQTVTVRLTVDELPADSP